MQDRVPLYPGRVTLTPVSGQANTFDLVRADQPTQEGTPLNKASLLKDTTAALFGLGTDAVPDDVLSQIFAFENNLGNMWVWAKAEPDYLAPGSSIDYGAEWRPICSLSNTSLYIYYSDSYTIVNGKAVLTNPSSIAGKDFTGNVNWFKPPIIGKYIQLINSSPYPAEGYKEVYKQAPNGDFKYENSTSYGNYLTLLSNFQTMSGNIIGYVLTSTNEAPTESGYVFKSMGQFGEKTRAVTGTYTGDGNDGREIALGFAPQAVFIAGYIASAYGFGMSLKSGGGVYGSYSTISQMSQVSCTSNGFKVGVGYAQNGNQSGQRYDYLAIG